MCDSLRITKALPHIHRQHVAFLDIVAIPGSLLTRESGHWGFPSRQGYRFPHKVMNHCGLKAAVRVKLAPMSFLGTVKKENPIYLGQTYLKANASNQVLVGDVLSKGACPRGKPNWANVASALFSFQPCLLPARLHQLAVPASLPAWVALWLGLVCFTEPTCPGKATSA